MVNAQQVTRSTTHRLLALEVEVEVGVEAQLLHLLLLLQRLAPGQDTV